jgi:hypothetical protein
MLFDDLLESEALLLGKFSRRYRYNRGSRNLAPGYGADSPHRLPTGKTDAAQTAPYCGSEVHDQIAEVRPYIHAPLFQSADPSGMGSSWLFGVPSDKVTHRRQIGCDRFRITRAQRSSELFKDGRVIAHV